MVSEATENPTSAAPPATAPESSPAPAAAAEASPSSGPAASGSGDKNGSQPVSLKALLEQHPELRQEYEREVQSRKDKELARDLARQRQALEAQQRQAWEAEQRKRERERIKNLDPLELGEEIKQRVQQEEQAEPMVDQALSYGMSQGEQRAWAQVRAELDSFPEWANMDQEEKLEWINTSAKPGDLFRRVVGHIVKQQVKQQAAEEGRKLAEAELAKYRQAAEREKRAEQRAGEPNPDLGSGAPVVSEQDFIKAFARGQSTDWARAKKALGL